jgi:hypothetical protein
MFAVIGSLQMPMRHSRTLTRIASSEFIRCPAGPIKMVNRGARRLPDASSSAWVTPRERRSFFSMVLIVMWRNMRVSNAPSVNSYGVDLRSFDRLPNHVDV